MKGEMEMNKIYIKAKTDDCIQADISTKIHCSTPAYIGLSCGIVKALIDGFETTGRVQTKRNIFAKVLKEAIDDALKEANNG